ncbi:MAG: MmcQ/YjbR family DNA-binding protein [Gemmatimonadetes bacterium]|nr:MmcQ/YjbR family DNA-binding protein [Gemmatimonadota bacterium]
MATVRAVLGAFPGVEEGPSYGTPGFRVKGKFLARLWEDGEVLVVKCGDTERDLRLAADPAIFFVTDHYRGHPTLLVHLGKVKRSDLREILEVAWRRAAPKALLAQHARSTKV